jgi:hypothetical protein
MIALASDLLKMRNHPNERSQNERRDDIQVRLVRENEKTVGIRWR